LPLKLHKEMISAKHRVKYFFNSRTVALYTHIYEQDDNQIDDVHCVLRKFTLYDCDEIGGAVGSEAH